MCGARPEFEIDLKKLLKRSGARTVLKRFEHTVGDIAMHNHLPDCQVIYDETRDMVIFRGRGLWLQSTQPIRCILNRWPQKPIRMRVVLPTDEMCICWSMSGPAGQFRHLTTSTQPF